MNNEISSTQYWLDPDNQIISVSSTWDQFALENDGETAVSSQVLGKQIWEFIDGDITKMWVDTLLKLCRTIGKYVERPYRCDSPHLKRYMTMGVYPEKSGVLRLEHIIVTTEPQATPIAFYAAQQPVVALRFRCSICGRINEEDFWIEPDTFQDAAMHTQGDGMPVAYTVCPHCRAEQRSYSNQLQSVV